MTRITAFDSKDFKRSNINGQTFFSPLGCGVTISKPKEFQKCYIEKLTQLLNDFNVSLKCSCFASSEYFSSAGRPKTYKIADELLKSVQKYIDSVFISYVILPSTLNPTVEVGGYKCPKKEIPTFNFLRTLSTYFSYITAFTYWNHSGRKNEQIFVDEFKGKITYTWEKFAEKINPVVYPHGDECNIYISTADMIASLTDKKLYDNRLRLNPVDVKKIWADYSFNLDVRFIDTHVIPQITWVSDELIDVTKYHAKPTIFLKADGYTTDTIKSFPVYANATLLARNLNGCLQGFNKKIDGGKVRDGDVFVYAGEESKNDAMTLNDFYDIKVISFKELKEKIKLPLNLF